MRRGYRWGRRRRNMRSKAREEGDDALGDKIDGGSEGQELC